MGSMKSSESLFLDGTEGCDIVVAGLTIGLDDFKGPFQPKGLIESVCQTQAAVSSVWTCFSQRKAGDWIKTGA